MLKKLWQWIEKNEGLVGLGLLMVALRIPSLFEPYWYGDEGIYLVLGQALRKGLVFYRDIHDNKPPLLYILAAIAGNVFYFRLLLMVWSVVALGVFFRLMQRLLPKNKKAWYGSSLAMIGLTMINEGNIANAEIFTVLPVVGGMLLAFEAVKQKVKDWRRWLGIGLIFSMGALLKVPTGLDWLAAVVWLVLFEKGLKDKRVWWLGLGFGLPIAATIGYYGIVGGLEPYVRSALLQNIGYLASWGTGEHTTGLAGQIGLISRGGVLVMALGVIYYLVKKHRLSSGFRLVVIWYLMALFGALLSERPYPHYLIQPVVPMAILASYWWGEKKRVAKVIMVGLAGLTAVAMWQVRFWHYPVLPYYRNFGEYVLRKKSLEDYRNFFDPRVSQTYKLAEYLRTKTLVDEQVFIWGDEPNVYALAERLPIGRYTVAYHVVDFNGYEETMEAWDKNQPKVVIVMMDEKREFPEMESRLASEYMLAKQIDKAMVYRRVNGMNHR